MLKISNETKIALFALVAVALGFWGFKFLKGINILTPARVFYVKYANTDQLRPSAPVFYNGLQIGMVKNMYVDKNDDKTIIVVLNVEADLDIPKDTKAAITGLTLMGGKAVKLVMYSTCEGGNCAQSGDFLEGTTDSFVASLFGPPEQVDAYTDKLKKVLSSDIDSLAKANPNGLGGTIGSVDESIRQLEAMIGRLNNFLDASTNSFVATGKNAEAITLMLRNNNADITKTIGNLTALSEELKNAGFDKKASNAIDTLALSLRSLRGTLGATQKTLGAVDSMATNLLAGKGNTGKLITDEALYENLVSTSQHLYLLTQDLRLHPERYTKVRVKLLGKHKGTKYLAPEQDPMYQAHRDSLNKAQHN